MNRRTSRTAIALVVVTAMPLAACGSDDDTDTGSAPAGATSPPATEAPGDVATITVSGFAFGGVEEVPVGTTVVVVNDDSAAHTWTAVDGTFDSGSLGQGDRFEFTFDEAGTFEYFCNFHPSMTGVITVTG